jgi:hypothetical protein
VDEQHSADQVDGVDAVDGTPAEGDRPDGQQVPEEEDHDLLTLTLATDRLAVAIAEERERLAAAESADDDAAATASRARVAQLEEAAERHRRVPITAVNAAEFYGWQPDDARPAGRA